MDVEVHATELPPDEVQRIRDLASDLERVTDDPPPAVRLTVRPGPRGAGPHGRRPFVADASAPVPGRLLAAHALGPTPMSAAEAAVDRLRRQLRRIVGAEVALRNEPRTIARAVEDLRREERPQPPIRRKPPEEREIVHRHAYDDEPESTYTAIANLLDDDQAFRLFVHARTNEDVVVYWRDDGRLGLLFPPGSVLEDEGDPIVPEPSRYSDPLPFAVARSEMDMLNHRFLYYLDAEDERGRVLYLRFDGDYGLVEPA